MPSDAELTEVLSSFISQFYLNQAEGRVIPAVILLGADLGEEKTLISDTLTELAGRKVELRTQSRGNRARYQKLAQTNANTALTSKLNHKMTIQQRFSALSKALELTTLDRMECFDISHTMGEKTVASCVVFNQDGPLKQEYRRYNITGITGGG